MEDLKQAEKEKMVETESRGSGNRTNGLALIAVGVVFLIVNFTGIRIDNWWALFILIPVVATWSDAWRTSQEAGALTGEAQSKMISSLFPLFVACIFLFNWDWGQVWPGFIILAGVAALFHNRQR